VLSALLLPTFLGAAVVNRNSWPFLRPDTLLVAERNVQDWVLQSIALHHYGFDPIVTKSMLY